MSKLEKIITLGGNLCIGGAALAFALPVGVTLAASAVTGFVALGAAFRAGCARRACDRAAETLLADLKSEYSEAVLERAEALLDGFDAARVIPKQDFVGTWQRGDFADHCAALLLTHLKLDPSDSDLHELLTRIFRETLAACRQSQSFREGLTLALVEKTACDVNMVLPALDEMLALQRETRADIADISATQAEHTALLHRLLAGDTAAADALPLTALRDLANRFGAEPGLGRDKLVDFLDQKSEEYRALQAQVEHIDERVAGLGNLKAAARDAIKRVDLEEVEALLSRVDEVETEIAAESKELRAQNALLRGRVDDAYRMFVAAADSFGSVDPVTVARRRDTYLAHLYRHCLRYGGTGFLRAIDMVRPILTDALRKQDAPLWGGIQNNLATALQEQGKRTGGAEGTALLTQAVAAYRAALEVRTRADHPVDWATTQNNLAIALREQGIRTGGAEGTALLTQAVAAYRAALEVRTRADHTVDWATTQNNLAIALREQGIRTGGAEGTALLTQAVAAWRAALEVRTRTDHPVDWATTQNNLANALAEQGIRTGGAEGTALLTQAVAAYRAALEVRTRAEHPVRWAATQENLAIAEKARAAHDASVDPRGHLQAALCHANKALEVFDPEHMRFNHDKATALKTDIEAALAAL